MIGNLSLGDDLDGGSFDLDNASRPNAEDFSEFAVDGANGEIPIFEGLQLTRLDDAPHADERPVLSFCVVSLFGAASVGEVASMRQNLTACHQINLTLLDAEVVEALGHQSHDVGLPPRLHLSFPFLLYIYNVEVCFGQSSTVYGVPCGMTEKGDGRRSGYVVSVVAHHNRTVQEPLAVSTIQAVR